MLVCSAQRNCLISESSRVSRSAESEAGIGAADIGNEGAGRRVRGFSHNRRLVTQFVIGGEACGWLPRPLGSTHAEGTPHRAWLPRGDGNRRPSPPFASWRRRRSWPSAMAEEPVHCLAHADAVDHGMHGGLGGLAQKHDGDHGTLPGTHAPGCCGLYCLCALPLASGPLVEGLLLAPALSPPAEAASLRSRTGSPRPASDFLPVSLERLRRDRSPDRGLHQRQTRDDPCSLSFGACALRSSSPQRPRSARAGPSRRTAVWTWWPRSRAPA